MNNEDDDLSRFYHAEAHKPEVPPALDDKILAMAKKQARVNQKRGKGPWLYWQYGGSIAASALLVSFVYFYNTIPIEQAEREIIPVPTLDSARLSKQSAPSQARAGAFENDLQESVEALQESAHSTNQGFESVVVTGARVKPETLALQKEAERLLSQLQAFQRQSQAQAQAQEHHSLMEKDVSVLEESSQNAKSYKQTQQALFEVLKRQKASSKSWDLDERFKAVLLEEQIDVLLKQDSG